MTESISISPALRKLLISYADKMVADGRSEGWYKGMYEGRRVGGRAGMLKAKRNTLERQLKRKFGPLPEETRSRVRALASSKEIDRYLDRVLDADSLAAMGLESAGLVPSSVRRKKMPKRKRKALGWGAELKENARRESWLKGRKHGHLVGSYLGFAQGKSQALVRQVTAKFGRRVRKTVIPLSGRWSLRELDRYLYRVLSASSVAEMDFREPSVPPIYEEVFRSSAITQWR